MTDVGRCACLFSGLKWRISQRSTKNRLFSCSAQICLLFMWCDLETRWRHLQHSLYIMQVTTSMCVWKQKSLWYKSACSFNNTDMLEEIKHLVFSCCGDQTWFPHSLHSTELFLTNYLDFIILICFYMQVKWSGVHFVHHFIHYTSFSLNPLKIFWAWRLIEVMGKPIFLYHQPPANLHCFCLLT